jgi:hypothetical protein
MAANIAEVIADYLEVQGVGTLGTNLFDENQPPEPAESVTVRARRGDRPLFGFGSSLTKPLARFPGVMVIVRSATVSGAWAKMNEVVSKLSNLQGLESAPFTVLHVAPDGDPEKRQENPLGNIELEMNFRVTMRVA